MIKLLSYKSLNMGEAKRRKILGLSPKKVSKISQSDESPRIFKWLPVTENQKNNFIKLSMKVSWFGIGFLIILWIIVRFIGPAFGWWTPADTL